MFILFKQLLDEIKLGEDFDCCHVGRLDDDIDEASRCFGDVRRLPIHELTDWEIVLLFKITLGEELEVEQVRPFPAKSPVLGWIGDVSQVEHQVVQLFLVLFALGVEFIRGHARFEQAEIWEVLGHVSCEDSCDHDLSDSLVFGWLKLDGPIILGISVHELK